MSAAEAEGFGVSGDALPFAAALLDFVKAQDGDWHVTHIGSTDQEDDNSFTFSNCAICSGGALAVMGRLGGWCWLVIWIFFWGGEHTTVYV